MTIHSFSELKRFSKQAGDDLPKVRMGVLADTASQYLTQAIRGTAISRQLDLQLFEVDYNQVDLQLLQPNSALKQFKPQSVLVYQDITKLRKRFYGLESAGERIGFASQQLENVEGYYRAATSAGAASFAYFNFPVTPDPVFGSFANRTDQSFTWQLRKLNFGLMELAARCEGFHVCDLAAIGGRVGYEHVLDQRMYVNSDVTLNLETIPVVAQHVVDIVQGLRGKSKKCLILDLDNTLWGGVIGDDGMANIELGDLGIGKAFSDLQRWAKQLGRRGIILAVCSKNTEAIARQPFEEHPEMVLSLDDIAVFVANWENKPDNIRRIQSILNIGFDSMVFLDDNPFERNIVRENLPEVTVPELPEDPAEYLPYLEKLNLFETVSFSANDGKRTAQYKAEAERVQAQESFTNESDFLGSLEMKSHVEPFTDFSIPRVTQLCQRSNQFNLRTIRYTDAEIRQIASSGQHHTLSFTLEDRFGKHGLIGVVILKKHADSDLFIDTWIMSCRVLKRTMEQFILNQIVATTVKNGYTRVVGEYLPTERNVIAVDLYADLGFTQDNSKWVLCVDGYESRETFVSPAEQAD